MEELHRLAHRQLQHFVDVQAVVLDLQDAALVARAFALFADQLHVGQKLHLDRHRAVALARLAAAARDVERKVPGRVAALLRLPRGGEQRADQVERLDVRHRIRTRRAADRRLVHHHRAA